MKTLVLAVLLGLAVPVCAQSADYETQRAAAKAPRFDSGAELREQSPPYLGKIIELNGTIKGIFGRGEGFALMLQLSDDSSTIIDAPAALGAQKAVRVGSFVRVLCRVDGAKAGDVALTLSNITNQAEPVSLLKSNDDDGIAFAPSAVGAPAPAAILLAPEMDLPPAPALSAGAPASNSAPAPRLISQTNSKTTSNPYYGFTDQHRANYRVLIRRINTKLSDAQADNIAGALLAAAQTHNLDPRFLCAVIKVESDFDPSCLSESGAMGLGQLMPFNLKPLGVQNAWDPAQNLHGTAKLLRQNLDIYAKQKDGTLLAVAAYHAGVGAVNRAGMKVPKATTQRYVWKVYYAYRALAPELFQ